MSSSIDFSVRHLCAELALIDVLLQRLVRLWILAGQNPDDDYRGLYVSDDEAVDLLARPLCGNWGQTAALSVEQERAFDEAQARFSREIEAIVEQAQREGQVLRLQQMAAAFGLDRFEVQALLICLAPILDLRYERLYGYLQDDVTRKQPSVNLILDLLCEPGPGRLSYLQHFGPEARLFKYRLLERAPRPGPGSVSPLSQNLVPDETVVAWLLGRYQPHAALGTCAELLRPQTTAVDELLARDLLDEPTGVSLDGKAPPILAFCGPDRMRQEAAARLQAARLGRSLLRVDLGLVVQGGLPIAEAVRLALRDARLTGALPCLVGWDACLDQDRRASADPAQGELAGVADGICPLPGVLEEVCDYPDSVVLVGERTWQPAGLDRRRALFWFHFPSPAYTLRADLWHCFLERRGVKPSLDLDVNALAGQFSLTSGQIRDAVTAACDRAAQERRPVGNEDLLRAARAVSNPHMSRLALKIVPRYTWSDIILPPDQRAVLRELVDTVRGRPVVLDEWGAGHKLVASRGVTVLFSGPPGTGKTMAAEVIANELGLDLFKIDLSTVVSKYIGETEKNLERVFDEGETSNAILFFDEADALFGKRSEVRDAHDRYANLEISYLLQRMESYGGVAILATNLRANMDEAFTRRLQFSVRFPFPEEEDRRRIWQTLFPEGVPRSAELDLGLMARRFRLAGGNIRNVIVSAAYLAAADGQVVTMAHLMHGTRRELQKMGRLVNEQDMTV